MKCLVRGSVSQPKVPSDLSPEGERTAMKIHIHNIGFSYRDANRVPQNIKHTLSIV
jgi:hypothetical protein